MQEIWKDVKGYEGLYQVSNLGRIKSIRNNIILKQRLDKDGYCIINLSNNGMQKHYRVHRLVAETFITNDNAKPQVNHLDGNKTNNYTSNLEWVTGKENLHHAIRNGLFTEDMMICKPRKVNQLDMNGNKLKLFNSLREAQRVLDIAHSNISVACSNPNKSAGGYKWKYAE
nr:NUMOD4 domain-containing protein [Sedimentibacter sp.]